MRADNWLANVFNFLGDALERFNPAAFRFLSASLPYLTPFPVAWLTADSASQFLNFTPAVAFIFVFSLEGIGLWFTSLLVDSIVDFIRSKNAKSIFPVIMFIITVGIYVLLLINLNVTLEEASGKSNPVLSRVITLMCFLPLITGMGNGYYKLKLEAKTDLEYSKQRQQQMELLKLQDETELRKLGQENELRKFQEQNELDFRKLQAENELKLQKFRIKQETSGSSKPLPKVTSRTNGTSETTSGSTSKIGRPSTHQERVFAYLEQIYSETKTVPSFKEVMEVLKLPQSTASRLRNEWIQMKEKS